MDLGLKGKVALVAAASRGLGRAVAEELAAEGVDLAVIVTAHPGVDVDEVLSRAPLVVDFRGVTRGIEASNLVRL